MQDIDTTPPAAPVLKDGATTLKAVTETAAAEKQSFTLKEGDTTKTFTVTVTQKAVPNDKNTVKAQYSLDNKTWADVPQTGLSLEAKDYPTVYLRAIDKAQNVSATQKYHIEVVEKADAN